MVDVQKLFYGIKFFWSVVDIEDYFDNLSNDFILKFMLYYFVNVIVSIFCGFELFMFIFFLIFLISLSGVVILVELLLNLLFGFYRCILLCLRSLFLKRLFLSQMGLKLWLLLIFSFEGKMVLKLIILLIGGVLFGWGMVFLLGYMFGIFQIKMDILLRLLKILF